MVPRIRSVVNCFIESVPISLPKTNTSVKVKGKSKCTKAWEYLVRGLFVHHLC